MDLFKNIKKSHVTAIMLIHLLTTVIDAFGRCSILGIVVVVVSVILLVEVVVVAVLAVEYVILDEFVLD